jgi:hypothetical protein
VTSQAYPGTSPPTAVRSGHIDNHRSLVTDCTAPPQLDGPVVPVDAIAVPASRAHGNVGQVAMVAAEYGCHLLVVCSGSCDPAAARVVASRWLDESRITIASMPPLWTPGPTAFRADRQPHARSRRADTGAKRNAAALMGLQLGWRRLMYLDDDVQGLTFAHVDHAAQVLSARVRPFDAVGWAFEDFPDNSMLCHARRATGERQSTFIGGGALAVALTPNLPFFPRVYNEDWLFMAPLLAEPRRGVGIAGTLRQNPFNPFDTPEAARRQEFGDILAEGLFRLLHTTHPEPLAAASSERYWAKELKERRALVWATARRLMHGAADPELDLAGARRALGIASRMHDERSILPRHLARWVQLWRQDLATWRRDAGP